MTKICTKCGEERNDDCFITMRNGRNDHYIRPDCKICCSKRSNEWAKKNKSKIKAYIIQYKMDNKEKMSKYFCDYKKRNKVKMSEYQREYFQRNKNKISEKNKQRRKYDIQYHLSCILRERLNKVIVGQYKSGSSINDLGCSLKELQTYIENKFETGMSWDNYGKWHIDHIIPLCKFDLKDREQFLKACHYTNLQPLWAKDNLSKGGY